MIKESNMFAKIKIDDIDWKGHDHFFKDLIHERLIMTLYDDMPVIGCRVGHFGVISLLRSVDFPRVII